MLAQVVNDEPAEVFTPLERFYMQAIGIEKGKPFNPDANAMDVALRSRPSRRRDGAANSFASPVADTYYYNDRKWQYVGDVPWIDPEGYRRWVAGKKRAFEDQVDKEMGAPQSAPK